MSIRSGKFTVVGRAHFIDSLKGHAGDYSSARYSVQHLRPCVRSVLLQVAGGEGIHPEIVRLNLASCVKSCSLRSEVFTIPSKCNGLRIKSSDVFLGPPGLGKGLGLG